MLPLINSLPSSCHQLERFGGLDAPEYRIRFSFVSYRNLLLGEVLRHQNETYGYIDRRQVF
jgi:hypothetical protein